MVNLKYRRFHKKIRWVGKNPKPHTTTITVLAFTSLQKNSHLMKIKKTGTYASQY